MKPKGTEGDRWRRRLQRARVALSLSGGAVSGGGRGGRGVCRTSFFSGHWRRSVPVLPSFVAPSAGGGRPVLEGGGSCWSCGPPCRPAAGDTSPFLLAPWWRGPSLALIPPRLSSERGCESGMEAGCVTGEATGREVDGGTRQGGGRGAGARGPATGPPLP